MSRLDGVNQYLYGLNKQRDESYLVFFFQAEDGIRDVLGSRGLGVCIRDRTTGVSNPVHDSCGQ